MLFESSKIIFRVAISDGLAKATSVIPSSVFSNVLIKSHNFPEGSKFQILRIKTLFKSPKIFALR